MSDTSYLGRQVRSFKSSPQFDGYSRVLITVSDEVEYSAGSDTGRTLRLTCPWGTQQMAQNILEDIRGFQYQPYTADGAIIDPSVELGDGITVNDVYSGVYTQSIKFGPLLTATVAAPEDEEINHEYPYQSREKRIVTRETKLLRAEMKIQADRITAEVAEQKSAVEKLTSDLSVQAGLIAAKVSKTGGDASSFGWELTDSDWTIKSGGLTVLRATKSGLEITGTITAKNGKIGGFDIKSDYLSYNSQTWGGNSKAGIYIGASGIQMGKNFKVDTQGNLTATSGKFTGFVRANKILYGTKSDGYFPGAGIESGTVTGGSGGQIAGSTINTSNMVGGINTSLSHADAAYNVCYGNVKAAALSAKALAGDTVSGTTVYITKLYLDGAAVYLDSIQIDGAVHKIIKWRD